MKEYKGLMKIRCGLKKCKLGLEDDVTPECIKCDKVQLQVIDLEGKILTEWKKLPIINKENKNGR